RAGRVDGARVLPRDDRGLAAHPLADPAGGGPDHGAAARPGDPRRRPRELAPPDGMTAVPYGAGIQQSTSAACPGTPRGQPDRDRLSVVPVGACRPASATAGSGGPCGRPRGPGPDGVLGVPSSARIRPFTAAACPWWDLRGDPGSRRSA